MRKVLFIPSGIGLGHATRTHNIMSRLKKRVDCSVAAYADAYPYFDKLGYEPVRLRGFNYHGEYSFELFQTLVKEADIFFKIAGDYLKLQQHYQEFPFDTIVSDSDPIGVVTANFLKKKNVLIENLQVVLDEAKYMPKWFQEKLAYQIGFIEQVERYIAEYLDLILVTSFNNRKYSNPKKHNVGLVVDGRVDEDSYREACKNDFVTIPINGSSLSYNLVHELINVFKKFPDQKFYFINFPTKTIKKIRNIYLFPFMYQPELKAYMKAGKAVVSFAGFSTLSDIAYLKKPSLILPLPNHIEQIANATFFRRNKLGEVVFPRQKYDAETVERLLSRMLSDLDSYSDNLDKMDFRFDGAKRCEELILKI